MDDKFALIMEEKKRFLVPMLIFLLAFYFMLPLSLTFFPEYMNSNSFIQGVSWGWLYTFLQIPMTWFLGWVYHQKSKKFDRELEKIRREELQ
ncbi:DUF485 domain-containing protein [Virgibacillus kimchii]